jgi:hypothetical protein
VEVKLEDDCGSIPSVAAVEQVGGVGEPVNNAPPQHKPRLVTTNQRRDQRLQAIGEDFGDALDCRVLKRYGPKVLRLSSPILFWEKHEIGTV